MKKLLAIAVVAAMTAPAMADTSVYGSARMLFNKDTLTVNAEREMKDNGTRVGFKGENSLNSGLTMTHQFELRGDLTGNSNGAGSNVSVGYGALGIKGGFGHVQIGRQDTVLDDVDGGAGYLTNGSFGVQPSDGQNDGQIKYTGLFGPVTALASYTAAGNRTTDLVTPNTSNTKSQLGLTYKAGPFKVGVGVASNVGVASTNGKSKIALSYKGANYAVGLVHAEDDSLVAVKSNTLGGKYSFGKAYVAAAYGKAKQGAGSAKQTDFEIGYKLTKGTKVYFQSKKETITAGGTASTTAASQSNALGVQHNF